MPVIRPLTARGCLMADEVHNCLLHGSHSLDEGVAEGAQERRAPNLHHGLGFRVKCPSWVRIRVWFQGLRFRVGRSRGVAEGAQERRAANLHYVSGFRL